MDEYRIPLHRVGESEVFGGPMKRSKNPFDYLLALIAYGLYKLEIRKANRER